MKMRRSPFFRLWAKFWVGLLIVGVVSPGFVWCYESDGRIAVEYGRECSSGRECSRLPHSEATSDTVTALTHSGESCNSCIDTPIFVVEAESGPSQSETPLSLHGAAVAPIESVPSQTSNLQPLIGLSLNTYQTNLTLSSVRSTILLI